MTKFYVSKTGKVVSHVPRKRKKGFYWVRLTRHKESVVARWDETHEHWYVPGSELHFTDNDFDFISQEPIPKYQKS